ncbi:hypothetical protein BKA61DRAFT_591223 [Leptodontidium sp. MPI-SDFR-AT-0119]|nr:hypothetical protein BKA61DRAFT_591223 [Leptodontidium sp. MPI-SDFR-AT-0119]
MLHPSKLNPLPPSFSFLLPLLLVVPFYLLSLLLLPIHPLPYYPRVPTPVSQVHLRLFPNSGRPALLGFVWIGCVRVSLISWLDFTCCLCFRMCFFCYIWTLLQYSERVVKMGLCLPCRLLRM